VQAPSTNVITLVVTDSGVPPLSDTKSLTVIVYRPNTPPVLTAILSQTVFANTLLTFSASATDTDQPPQALTFSLGAGAPAGASISTEGVFNWTPGAAQSPSTNAISVLVTDNGLPPLSDSSSFTVIVAPVLTLQASSTVSGPFTDDPNAIIDPAQKTITTLIGASERFYQLRSDTALRVAQIQIIGNRVVLHYQ
jgi:hypothetical protein